MEAQLHQTREAWLNYIAERMAPVFEKLGAPLPAQLRIAIGFTSSGRRSRRIGECWDSQCSEDRIVRFLFGLTWVTRKTCCRCEYPKSLATSWCTLQSVLRRVMARSSDESPGA
jgi:hypothetical protein